ncbi:MAG: hypothetical protein ACR2KB_11570 [Chitinophagaceae bacterium]|jgi:hypothetical protein
MDEIKLSKWKERFEQEISSIQIEYNSFFLKEELEKLYSIKLNESNEWELQLSSKLPNDVTDRLTQSFLAAKPEDSI